MKEIGEVVSVKKDIAQVKINKKDECAKCGMCLFNNADSIILSVFNGVNAVKGDKVIIEKSESNNLLSLFLIFVVPMILIGVAVLLGYIVMKNELWMLFFSLIFIFLWVIVLYFIDKKLRKKKIGSYIVSVMEKGEDNGN